MPLSKSELNSSSIGSVKIMRCFSLKDSRAAADLEKANKEKEKLQGQVEALKKAAQVRSHCFEVLFLVCHLIMQRLLSNNLASSSTNTSFKCSHAVIVRTARSRSELGKEQRVF